MRILSKRTDLVWSMFDRKVVLCYTGYMNRYNSIRREIERIGMNWVEYWFDFPTPLKDILKCGLNTTPFTSKNGPFSCLIAHYSVIKQTYEMGFESLLVMEDDIRFLKDIGQINKIVLSLPSDWDYVQFERAKPYEMTMGDWLDLKNGKRINDYWLRFVDLRGGGCYALTRKAMSRIITEIERAFVSKTEKIQTNDYYVKRCNELNRYFCYPSVAVQTKITECNSDIDEYWRRNELDGIHFGDYNTEGTVTPILDSDDFMKKLDMLLSRDLQSRIIEPAVINKPRIFNGWGNKPGLEIVLSGFEHVTEGKVSAAVLWGYNQSEANKKALSMAMRDNAKVLMCEPGFISSGTTWADKNSLGKYRIEHSVMVDCFGQFFDGTRSTQIERMLNNKFIVPTKSQIREARNLIDLIVSNKVSKYNHQPIFTPEIGRKGKRKVLVVDQSYGDLSIARGCASEKTFEDMLQAAITENPDADIIVKTHPDTIAGKTKVKSGYYSDLKSEGRIYKVTYPINPYSLMEICDKVYVCTSQFGIEGLMAGKEVHVFGMPFYAGWGLTIDAQKCSRRTNKRSLEELVYIFYKMYTKWMLPEENRMSTVEEVIAKVLEYRKEMLGNGYNGKTSLQVANSLNDAKDGVKPSVVCHPDKDDDGW